MGPCSVTEGRTALERDRKAHKSPRWGLGCERTTQRDTSRRELQRPGQSSRAPPTAPQGPCAQPRPSVPQDRLQPLPRSHGEDMRVNVSETVGASGARLPGDRAVVCGLSGC